MYRNETTSKSKRSEEIGKKTHSTFQMSYKYLMVAGTFFKNAKIEKNSYKLMNITPQQQQQQREFFCLFY